MRRRRWLLYGSAAALLLVAVLRLPTVLSRSQLLFPPGAENGVGYVMYAHVPRACRTAACPALYVLDGERWLPTFARIVDERVRAGDMAPVVLVGIGYRDVFNTAARRTHDFTPAFGRQPGRTGGADAYLQVLERELIPYAEARLPISHASRGLAGHSYAGLFATYALQRRPDLFDRYLIMSPALWFDDGKIYRQPFAAASASAQVFIAADTPRGVRSEMAEDALRLNDLLVQQAGLSVSHALLVGSGHDSMVAPAARRALPSLYPAPGRSAPALGDQSPR